jgi:hypothetical protein
MLLSRRPQVEEKSNVILCAYIYQPPNEFCKMRFSLALMTAFKIQKQSSQVG